MGGCQFYCEKWSETQIFLTKNHLYKLLFHIFVSSGTTQFWRKEAWRRFNTRNRKILPITNATCISEYNAHCLRSRVSVWFYFIYAVIREIVFTLLPWHIFAGSPPFKTCHSPWMSNIDERKIDFLFLGTDTVSSHEWKLHWKQNKNQN